MSVLVYLGGGDLGSGFGTRNRRDLESNVVRANRSDAVRRVTLREYGVDVLELLRGGGDEYGGIGRTSKTHHRFSGIARVVGERFDQPGSGHEHVGTH